MLANLFLAAIPTHAQTIYVSTYSLNTIYKIDASGNASVFATASSGLNDPYGLAIDTNGNLYVANVAGNIERFSTNGQGSVFADLGSYVPFDLAFDHQNNLYTVAYGPGGTSILKLDSYGNMSVLVTTTQEFGFSGLAFDSSNSLYTGNSYTTIEKLDTNGVGAIFASGIFYNPTGLAFDSNGNLYVSSVVGTIARFDRNGNGSVFASTNLISGPFGIVFDSRNNLYVANDYDGNVLKFGTNGMGSVFASGLGSAVGIAVQIPEIVASFTAAPTGGFPPLAVTFTDTSSGVVTNWFWSFGDGGTTNVTTNSVIYTYNAAGLYTVTEIVTGPDGVSTNVQPNYINAYSLLVSNTNDSGAGSLRQAVLDANLAGGGTIVFSSVTGLITLTSGELLISANVSINGPGATSLAISGNGSSRVFDISPGTTVNISGLTIQNGAASTPYLSDQSPVTGGGIYNAGSVTLSGCVISNNVTMTLYYDGEGSSAPGGNGGGIYNAGTMVVSNCVVRDNSCSWSLQSCDAYGSNQGGSGGGIFNAGTLSMSGSVISGNSAGGGSGGCNGYSTGDGGDGGGLYNADAATLSDCIISSNSAGGGGWSDCCNPGGSGGSGGGIYGGVSLTNCTIFGNSAGGGGNAGFPGPYGSSAPGGNGGSGGGIYGGGILVNCTVYSNSAGSGGCGGGTDNGCSGCTGGVGGNGGSGGGIAGGGTLINCTVYANNTGNGGCGGFAVDVTGVGATGGSGGSGGGISGGGTFVNCTIYGNSTGNGGSGSDGYGTLTTGGVGGNGGSGGGIDGGATLVNCTISSNSVGQAGPGGTAYEGANSGNAGNPGMGGGLDGGSEVLNTLVAYNTAAESGSDVSGVFTSLGYNLIGNTSGSSGFGVAGDLLNVNPLLAPLANNSGPTPTCALLQGSPAIDAGDDAVLSAPYNLTTDQRGYPRLSGAHVDIGAFEFGSLCPLTISIRSSPANAGAVSESGPVQCGSNVTVCASPTSCYTFANWTDQNGNIVSGSACYTLALTADEPLTANFALLGPPYTVTTSSSQVGAGSTSGGGAVACGSNVTVCATANPCYSFANWALNGSVVSTLACYTFNPTGNATLVANFNQVTYTIGTSSSAPGVGSASGGGTVLCGSNVTVCATDPCHSFENWTLNGTVVSTSACYTSTPTGNETLVANYASPTSYVEITTTNTLTSAGFTTGGGAVPCGSDVTVCATPNPCYTFTSWAVLNGSMVSTSACYTLTATNSETLVANFQSSSVYPTITTGSWPSNGGSTTGGGTVLCGSDVTVCATPNPCFNFAYWTLNESLVSTSGCYTFPAGSNETLVANFAVNNEPTVGSFNSLWSFTGSSDGANPEAGLVQGNDGNFYGTTYGSSSGPNVYGTVFMIGTNGVLTTLWSFNNGVDGANPGAGLIQGIDGNFYGTTYGSGSGPGGYGSVFRISSSGDLTSLWLFTNGVDGANPYAGLVQGSDGNFYGTTYGSGSGPSAYGTVFRISPGGILTNLWSFTGGNDGANPSAALVQGSDGNFYGTTYGSGSGPSAYGTVFRISPGGNLAKLWSFTNGLDGANSYAALVSGDGGNLYGTTSEGGASGNGTVFRISASGSLTNLWEFSGGCSDGAIPYAGLVQGSDGNFYGTTSGGEASGFGTAFRISPSGSLTILWLFTDGSDGAYPYAPLIQGSDGNFYGTAYQGGTNGNYGTVFRLSVPLSPPANQISGIQLLGTNLVVTIPSVAGETYQLQYCESLTLSNWNNIGGVSMTNSIGGLLSLTNLGGALQPQGFYRFAITP